MQSSIICFRLDSHQSSSCCSVWACCSKCPRSPLSLGRRRSLQIFQNGGCEMRISMWPRERSGRWARSSPAHAVWKDLQMGQNCHKPSHHVPLPKHGGKWNENEIRHSESSGLGRNGSAYTTTALNWQEAQKFDPQEPDLKRVTRQWLMQHRPFLLDWWMNASKRSRHLGSGYRELHPTLSGLRPCLIRPSR